MMPHERLEAWQAVRELTVQVYRGSDVWPSAERFGLTAQIRWAAVSVCANLAEGAARNGRREYGHFLDIALGSLAEVAALLTLASDLGYLSPAGFANLRASQQRAGRLLWGLHQAIRRNS